MKIYFYLIITCCVLCASTTIPTEKTGRIFLSRDQGESWLQTDTGFPDNASVNAMVLSSNVVVIGTEEHGIYISEDGLKSWHPSNRGLPFNIKINALVVHNNLLVAGTSYQGIFISYDNGLSWEQSSEGLTNPNVQSFYSNGSVLNVRSFYSNGSVLLAGTDTGIYQSDDQGKNWKLRIQGAQVNAFTSLNGAVFAATSNGALRSEDRGKTWSWIWNRGALFNIAVDGQNVISVVSSTKVFVASGNQNTWITLDPNFSHYTFQITPSSGPLLISPWRNVFKPLRNNQPFRNDGLPEQSSFTKILVTPYGILVGVGFGGC